MEIEKNFNQIRDYLLEQAELKFSDLPADFTNKDNIDWIDEMTSKLFRIQNEIKRLQNGN